MLTIGIRELKQQTSQILRRVREQNESVEITYHGEAIARLIPIEPKLPSVEDMAAILTDLQELSAEISVQWPKDISALDAVNDVRREL